MASVAGETTQFENFREAARKCGADDQKVFEHALRQIVEPHRKSETQARIPRLRLCVHNTQAFELGS